MLLAVSVISAGAADVKEIVSLADKKPIEIKAGTELSGIIISDFRSKNMAHPRQIAWNKIDVRDYYTIAYLEDNDASVGVRLVFSGIYDMRIPRFSSVVLDLTGCTIEKDAATAGCTIRGLNAKSVKSFTEGTQAPQKVKRIAELSDSDIYTYVRIPDVEFLSKEGSYTNIREFHAQRTDINAFTTKAGSDWFDESGLYVKDKWGDALFLPVNTLCSWRRRGDRMPSGIGSVSGIVVSEKLRRCGLPSEGLRLRIADPSDVSIPMDGKSSYDVIASWDWDRNYYYALKCEGGEKQWLERMRINYERVAPDKGTGWLGVTVPCTMGLEADYNTRCAQDGLIPGEGNRECASIVYDSKSLDWFSPSAAVTVEFSTEGVSGSALSLDFTWCAGTPKAQASGYPVHWKFAYSLDGKNFIPMQKVFMLCPIQWDGGSPVSMDASMGLTENTITLPAILLGKPVVYVRIFPCDRVAARISANYDADICSGRPEEDSSFTLRFGKIVVSALK